MSIELNLNSEKSVKAVENLIDVINSSMGDDLVIYVNTPYHQRKMKFDILINKVFDTED